MLAGWLLPPSQYLKPKDVWWTKLAKTLISKHGSRRDLNQKSGHLNNLQIWRGNELCSYCYLCHRWSLHDGGKCLTDAGARIITAIVNLQFMLLHEITLSKSIPSSAFQKSKFVELDFLNFAIYLGQCYVTLCMQPTYHNYSTFSLYVLTVNSKWTELMLGFGVDALLCFWFLDATTTKGSINGGHIKRYVRGEELRKSRAMSLLSVDLLISLVPPNRYLYVYSHTFLLYLTHQIFNKRELWLIVLIFCFHEVSFHLFVIYHSVRMGNSHVSIRSRLDENRSTMPRTILERFISWDEHCRPGLRP